MPHLDVTTYITQYSWTLIILFLFYSILCLFILPKIRNTLHIRKVLQGKAAAPRKGINKAYNIIQDVLR